MSTQWWLTCSTSSSLRLICWPNYSRAFSKKGGGTARNRLPTPFALPPREWARIGNSRYTAKPLEGWFSEVSCPYRCRMIHTVTTQVANPGATPASPHHRRRVYLLNKMSDLDDGLDYP